MGEILHNGRLPESWTGRIRESECRCSTACEPLRGSNSSSVPFARVTSGGSRKGRIGGTSAT